MFCIECNKEVNPILIMGREVYPHRPDLYNKYFYKCPVCNNYVGCHKNTKRPLGSIPNKEIKEYRKRIHSMLDPLWETGSIKRTQVYKRISKELGYTYHTGEIKSKQEAERIINIIIEIEKGVKYEECKLLYRGKINK